MGHFAFLDALRSLAALLVVWDHFVGAFCTDNGIRFLPLAVVESAVTAPLGIIQHFGFLGVALFFYVSGFIITHVIMRETTGVFLVRRFFRIYPPLVVSIAVAVLLAAWSRGAMPYTASEIARACTLANYVWLPPCPINGVAWTLAIEILFYLVTAASAPLLRSYPFLAVLATSCLQGAILYWARSFGDRFFLFAASAAYLPFLIAGQIFYLHFHAKALGAVKSGVLALLQYGLLLWGLHSIHERFLPITNSYLVSAAYALGLFAVFYRLPPPCLRFRAVGVLADHSYSLYLFHGVVGLPVLMWAFARLGYVPALAIALAVTASTCALVYGLVEKPSIAAGRQASKLYALWRSGVRQNPA